MGWGDKASFNDLISTSPRISNSSPQGAPWGEEMSG